MPEHRCDALRRLPSLVSRPRDLHGAAVAILRGVHGGVHHPCFGGVGRSRSHTDSGLQNPCVQTQTPHGDGVCGTSSLCRAKAHTGFELVSRTPYADPGGRRVRGRSWDATESPCRAL